MMRQIAALLLAAHVAANRVDQAAAHLSADGIAAEGDESQAANETVVQDATLELAEAVNETLESAGHGINLLLHNPHWECFERDPTGHCKGNAWGQYTRFLQSYSMDFGGLLMGGKYNPPDGYQKIEHLAALDRSALIWKTSAWSKEDHTGGEFEYGRSFIVGRFKNRHSGLRVVVIAAHYSHHVHHGHSAGAHHLNAAVQRMKAGTDKVILMADTNQNVGGKSNHQLLVELGAASDRTWAHEPTGTCCLDTAWSGGGMTFDRIAANFGRNLHEIRDHHYIQTTNSYSKGPWWAYHAKKFSGGVAAYHHPILAKLEL